MTQTLIGVDELKRIVEKIDDMVWEKEDRLSYTYNDIFSKLNEFFDCVALERRDVSMFPKGAIYLGKISGKTEINVFLGKIKEDTKIIIVE